MPFDRRAWSIYPAHMDDDREAYKFSHALYLARQVDREAAQIITEAAEAGLIQIDEATDLLTNITCLGDVIAALLGVRLFR